MAENRSARLGTSLTARFSSTLPQPSSSAAESPSSGAGRRRPALLPWAPFILLSRCFGSRLSLGNPRFMIAGATFSSNSLWSQVRSLSTPRCAGTARNEQQDWHGWDICFLKFALFRSCLNKPFTSRQRRNSLQSGFLPDKCSGQSPPRSRSRWRPLRCFPGRSLCWRLDY